MHLSGPLVKQPMVIFEGKPPKTGTGGSVIETDEFLQFRSEILRSTNTYTLNFNLRIRTNQSSEV